MPILYRMKTGPYYAKSTSADGAVLIYWITAEGVQMLESAGIRPEMRFEPDMLNRLICSARAFAQATRRDEKPKVPNPVPEKNPPSCEGCSSLDDLHLAVMRCGDRLALIQCADCRSKSLPSIDISIPLVIVTRAVLNQLTAMKKIKTMGASVRSYKKLLDNEHKTKMDERSKDPPPQLVMDDVVKGTLN